MYLHLFASETTYSSTLLSLLDRNIDLQEHSFVFGLGKSHPISREYKGQLDNRIFFLKKPQDFLKIIRLIKNAKWIYFHFLAYDPTLFYWLIRKKKIKNATWIIWGADVYAYKKARHSLRNKLYEKARKKLIPFFPEIAAFVKDDFEIVNKVYNTRAEYVPILYPIPVNLDHLAEIQLERLEGEVKIMIGNSGDESNEHIDVLQKIARFSEENILIICPLSYGGTPEYIDSVCAEGKRLFGDKFVAVKEMMQANDYAHFLAHIDIVLMNHQRQQGLGNIMALLFLEKKIFMRKNTTSFDFLVENGCKIELIETLDQISFNDFINFTDELKNNRIVMKEMLTDEFPLNRWKNLFNRH